MSAISSGGRLIFAFCREKKFDALLQQMLKTPKAAKGGK